MAQKDRRKYSRAYYRANRDIIRAKGDKYAAEHRNEARERSRQYYIDNPTRVKDNSRRSQLRKYGLTPESYAQLLAAQEGVCRICHEPETKIIRGKLCNLAVDHDHKTASMAVRGLLCSRCNAVLGLVKDNPLLLQEMCSYLQYNAVAETYVTR